MREVFGQFDTDALIHGKAKKCGCSVKILLNDGFLEFSRGWKGLL